MKKQGKVQSLIFSALCLLGMTVQSSAATTIPYKPYVDVALSSITQWDPASQSMQPLGLLPLLKNPGLKALRLSFITSDGGQCAGTWAGYPVSEDPEQGFGMPVFKKLREQGAHLSIALGGLNGEYLSQACKSTVDLQSVYEEIVRIYKPTSLDFDLENNIQTNNAQLDRLMQAIQGVKNNYTDLKISFTLPVLPTGLVENLGLNVLKRAEINGLSDYAVNIMAMDYGDYFGSAMGENAIKAATNTFKQLKALYPDQSDATLWSRIEVTPMIGLNDTSNDQVPQNFALPGDVKLLKAFAAANKINGLSAWSITRDHSCNDKWVSTDCSSQNPMTKKPNQAKDFEYSKYFMSPVSRAM
ncbi:MAG: chitinase [Pseudomonadota bacterium]